MDFTIVLARAEIAMLTREQGGRDTPLQGGLSYRPNHNFWPDADFLQTCIGFIDLPVGHDFSSSKPVEVQIRFLVWPELQAQLYPGREWRIQEASKIVGYGKILQILT